VKLVVLVPVPKPDVTEITPVVAPAGTVVVMEVPVFVRIVAATPL
jgi:hypothetical protein